MTRMLRPQDSATRERKALDGRWRFRLDVDGVGRAERWFAGPLRDAQDMAVPASYNDLLDGPGHRDHVGEVWYQRTVRVPRGWAVTDPATTRPPRASREAAAPRQINGRVVLSF